MKVQTASPGELIVLLYDCMLRHVAAAATAFEQKDRATAGHAISRAHAILEHLLASLDKEGAPKLWETLAPLYAFGMRSLVEANLAQDGARLAKLVELFTPLRDAWGAAARASEPAR